MGQRNRRLCRCLILSVAAAVVLLAGGRARAADADRLGGVWQVVTPIRAVKTTDGRSPPLLPGPARLYAQRVADDRAGRRAYDPTLRCKPMGEPRTSYDPAGGPFELLVNPKLVVFTYTWNRMVRFVYLTDKPVDVIGPSYYGTAHGHWDGPALVIDAQGFHDSTLLDEAGMPHSDRLHLIERFAVTGNGRTLVERLHVDDPGTFSAPWDTVITYRRLPGARIAEDVCTERQHITGY